MRSATFFCFNSFVPFCFRNREKLEFLRAYSAPAEHRRGWQDNNKTFTLLFVHFFVFLYAL